MAPPIRILLVEDNDVFRNALELLFELEDDLEVVGSVADGSAAAPAVLELRPDVVIMDYRLPGMDGVEATQEVVRADPDARVVALTASASARELEALSEAGALQCLRKDEALDEIVSAIRRAAGRVDAADD